MGYILKTNIHFMQIPEYRIMMCSQDESIFYWTNTQQPTKTPRDNLSFRFPNEASIEKCETLELLQLLLAPLPPLHHQNNNTNL